MPKPRTRKKDGKEKTKQCYHSRLLYNGVQRLRQSGDGLYLVGSASSFRLSGGRRYLSRRRHFLVGDDGCDGAERRDGDVTSTDVRRRVEHLLEVHRDRLLKGKRELKG